jgi:hypothetical protein
MIKLTLELYLQNKRLINGSDEDMQVGISNLINIDVSDTVIIAIAKSLDAQRRSTFISQLSKAENWNTETEALERMSDLREKCKPWSDLFQILRKGSISNIEKRIVEYEITMLYLNSMSDKNFVKKINLELAW